MLATIGYLQFPTHTVKISRDGDRIYCFKSTDTRCDLASFTDQEEASMYIMRPFPSLVYEIKFPEDDQTE